MKLQHYFIVNGAFVKIVTASITVSLDAPGVGIVEAISTKPLSGAVQYCFGTLTSSSVWFTGDIVSSTATSAKTQRVLIHERGQKLEGRFPLFLRNTTPAEILKNLAAASLIVFRADEGGWLNKPISHFSAMGRGMDVLATLKQESGVEDFAILHNADGSIYLGSMGKSSFALNVTAFPESMFSDVSVVGASVAAIPGMRPGHRIKIGDHGDVKLIESIMLSGNFFRLQFREDSRTAD